MKVEDLIVQLQDLFNDAKSMPFSGGKVLIPMELWSVLFRFDQPASLVCRATGTDAMTQAGKAAADHGKTVFFHILFIHHYLQLAIADHQKLHVFYHSSLMIPL